MDRFLVVSTLIWIPLVAGIVWRHFQPRVFRWTRPILLLDLWGFTTYAYFIAAWGLDIETHGWLLVTVPLVGLFVSYVNYLAGGWLARRWALPPRQHGAFVAAAAISNIGLTFGMSLAFALFGLQGQALAGLFNFYFPFFTFLVLFTMADRLGREAAGELIEIHTWSAMAGRFLRDPSRTVPISAFVLGFIMNRLAGFANIPNPMLLINEYCIYANIATAFIAVGFAIHVGHLRRHAGLIGWLCGIKFVLAPALGVACAVALGFRGESLAVLALLCATPVGIFSVLASAIYRLDAELAGGALLITTIIANVLAFGLMLFLWMQ